MGVTARARAGEAQIAVTGVGGSGTGARAFLRAELGGVRYAELASHDEAPLADALDSADMLVFVADGDDAPDRRRTLAIAEAARRRGMLVAALVAGTEPLGTGAALLTTLRDAADMVVLIRDPRDVLEIVAALR